MTRHAVLRASAVLAEGRTVLSRRYHHVPLKLTKTFREPVSDRLCVCMMDVSPGMLDGDRYEVELELAEGTELVVTNQSFTRIHPTPASEAVMRQSLTLGRNAVLEYFPEPVIPYRGSRFRSEMTVRLAEGALLLYADVVAPGRIHHGECFDYDCVSSTLEVYEDDRLAVWDRWQLQPASDHYQAMGALESYTHVAAFWVLGLSDFAARKVSGAELLEAIRELLPAAEAAASGQAAVMAAASLTGNGGIAVRMLGRTSWELQELVAEVWALCRRLLWGLPPCRLRK